ncbi:MAG TPA: DUF4157 domain-containing protein [Actinomycetota bacterium]|nr:DUF4157 domain-containing protein [Actinomycetota bacterium]
MMASQYAPGLAVRQRRVATPTAGVLQRCGARPCPRGACDHDAERPVLQRRSLDEQGPSTAPAIVSEVVRSSGQPLAPATRGFMEARFGHDFSQVRVHSGAAASESARAVGALAYTVGRDVVLGDGHDTPGREGGRRLLAHELAHVVQQSGRGQAVGLAGLRVEATGTPAEREARIAAEQAVHGDRVPALTASGPSVHRLEEPHITRVNVNLTSQTVKLEWRGTPPSEPGSDSFTCSTGKGYGNPGDPPGTCKRDCCAGPDQQCAPPHDRPGAIGSCCTPIGSGFWTGRPRPEHNGWLYWTPVEPIHTSGGRGIALHQHDEVTGQAIGHGCIRMEEGNAHRIYLYSRGKATNVTITGRATVACPVDRRCGASGALGPEAPVPGMEAAALTRPDEEPPGGGRSAG